MRLTKLSRAVLEKLIVRQLFENISTFYENKRLHTVFRRNGHLSLSWTRSIHSTSSVLFLQDLRVSKYPPLCAYILQVSFWFPAQNSTCIYPRTGLHFDIYSVVLFACNVATAVHAMKVSFYSSGKGLWSSFESLSLYVDEQNFILS
jgi:hypothetical protein